VLEQEREANIDRVVEHCAHIGEPRQLDEVYLHWGIVCREGPAGGVEDAGEGVEVEHTDTQCTGSAPGLGIGGGIESVRGGDQAAGPLQQPGAGV